MSKLERILSVEDDVDLRELLKDTLELLGGYTVKACASGPEALLVAAEFSPQLILLDVMMPQMDGPTTLQRLRKLPSLEGVPVVFMTAKTSQKDIASLLSLGAVEVIPKPFDSDTLSHRLQGIWQASQR